MKATQPKGGLAMRRLAILIAALAMLAAIPASANAAFVNRQVKTTCLYNPTVGINTIYTVKAIDDTRRHTTIPCNGYVPNLSKPNESVNRPTTDVYAAQQSADRWWPKCGWHWYATTGPQAAAGWPYDWYFWFGTICT